MKKKLPDVVEDIRQKIMGNKPDQSWGQSASEAYSATVEGLKGFGGDTLGKTAQTFNEALPYIERAGYVVTEIEVGLGLSPKIVPHLKMQDVISDEEQAMLLFETQDKKLVNTILSSLFKATAARKKLKFKKFHFNELELELSILPTVTLKFKPNENTDETLPDIISDDIKPDQAE